MSNAISASPLRCCFIGFKSHSVPRVTLVTSPEVCCAGGIHEIEKYHDLLLFPTRRPTPQPREMPHAHARPMLNGMRRFFTLLALLLPIGLPAAPLDFAQSVLPVLQKHCVPCHGPEKQKSEYRIDSRAAALAGGESGEPALIPGNPDKSRILHLVEGTEKELFMPPRKSDIPPLSKEQISTLRTWIAQGAPWPDAATLNPNTPKKTPPPTPHWAFQPLRKPALPATSPKTSHPIDAFIRAELHKHGLAAATPASPRELLRRLHFDLTGLAPSVDDINRFTTNPSQTAYHQSVDALLASPRHGERWARHWLDIVHFGETHGYDKDKPRMNAWPYRDYVIRALNRDKPYSRFIEEQIAGDTLHPDTVDGITALGFIAAGPWDLIGHAEVPETKTDGKIARHLDRDDMVANTINTFQSVTVHCAQCHDHKFDPVSQRDYYALQAVFAALDRADVDYYPDDESMRKFSTLNAQRRSIQTDITQIEAALIQKCRAAYDALTKRIDGIQKSSTNPNAAPDYGYHSAIATTDQSTKWVQVDLGETVDVQRIILKPCYDDFGKIGAGFGFPVRFKIEVSDDPSFQKDVLLVWRKHDATFMNDFPNPGLTAFETGTAKDDGVRGRYVRVTATKLAPRSKDYIFALAELEVFSSKEGPNLAVGKPVTALDSIEAPPRWRKLNLTDGIAPKPQSSENKNQLLQERDQLLLAQADDSTRNTLLAKRAELKSIPSMPAPQKVYAGGVYTGTGAFKGTGAEGGKPRPIHLLRRGDVKQPGDPVAPGALSAIGNAFNLPFPELDNATEAQSRAALARWITHPNNALTWRSIVNRVWQFHFGRGLVETPNDFGKMGATPSHPELLDWLAIWFRDEAKGSLKALHRLIVTSETYQQTASPSPESTRAAHEKDSNNALLWKQNRRRLEAEAIRDSILQTAGKLDLTMEGPSFQDFVIDKPAHSPHYEYHLANPEDPRIHRRAIYRFIVRSQQQPWMATLDCADPSMLVDRRNITITPLQALAQLNNQLTVAMSAHFAKRVESAATNPTDQIKTAFQIALQRDPTPSENDLLQQHLSSHGLANACRLILNLNEFVFVD